MKPMIGTSSSSHPTSLYFSLPPSSGAVQRRPSLFMSDICPVCSSTSRRLVVKNLYRFKGNTFDLVCCSGCGLNHVSPLPDDEMIGCMYSEGYFEEDWVLGCCQGSYEEITRRKADGEYLKVVEAIEKRAKPPKGILFEVGAAGGGFLDFARKRA